MNKFLSNFLLVILLGSLVYPGMPVSKEAKLIEQVSSSEWLIEATGKYLSLEKRDRKG